MNRTQNIGVAVVALVLVMGGSFPRAKHGDGMGRSYCDNPISTPYMDYKGHLLSAENLGNYAYGYLGAAYGYGEEFLCAGAGGYQVLEGHSDWPYVKTYFDEPEDNAMIRLGWAQYWADKAAGVI